MYWRQHGELEQALLLSEQAIMTYGGDQRVQLAVAWVWHDALREALFSDNWQQVQHYGNLLVSSSIALADSVLFPKVCEVAVTSLAHAPHKRAAEAVWAWVQQIPWVKALEQEPASQASAELADQYAGLLSASLHLAGKWPGWLDFLLWWGPEHLRPADFSFASGTAVMVSEDHEISLAAAFVLAIRAFCKTLNDADMVRSMEILAQHIRNRSIQLGTPITA